jgi:hypothetical protein
MRLEALRVAKMLELTKRESNPWDDDRDFLGRKVRGKTYKLNHLLDFDEHGRHIRKPSDIFTNAELQTVEPPTVRRRKRIKE